MTSCTGQHLGNEGSQPVTFRLIDSYMLGRTFFHFHLMRQYVPFDLGGVTLEVRMGINWGGAGA